MKRSPRIDPTKIVIAKYEKHGWTVIVARPGRLADLIAQRGSALHFVQVVVSQEDPRTIGLAANTFIQNAFSNGSRPIRADVVGGAVKFTDTNDRSRVIIRSAKPPTPKPSTPKPTRTTPIRRD